MEVFIWIYYSDTKEPLNCLTHSKLNRDFPNANVLKDGLLNNRYKYTSLQPMNIDFNDLYLQCLQLYGTWLTNYILVL